MRNSGIMDPTEYANAGTMLSTSPGVALNDWSVQMQDHSTPEIPQGYCQCGCGEQTALVKHTDRKLGIFKGQPRRFRPSHQLRIPAAGKDVFHGDGSVSVAMYTRNTQYTHVRIDEADYDLVKGHRWHPSISDKRAYAACTLPDSRKDVYLHRLLLDAPKGRVVDHINHDTLDCRRSNLRVASHSQNSWNMQVVPRGATKYKGVVVTKMGYGVKIMKDRKNKWLGRYDDPAFAARVYDAAAEEVFGEFAHKNFPNEPLDPEAKEIWEWYRDGNKRTVGYYSQKRNRTTPHHKERRGGR